MPMHQQRLTHEHCGRAATSMDGGTSYSACIVTAAEHGKRALSYLRARYAGSIADPDDDNELRHVYIVQ